MTNPKCNPETCGTCAFWNGARGIDHTNNLLQVASNVEGICTERWRGFDRRETDHCDQWQRWSALERARAA